jgi:two-component system sensor histidine kinase RegB
LTQLSGGGAPFDRMSMAALIEEVLAPFRNFGVDIEVGSGAREGAEPVGARNPAILYGLGNLMENAIDFAESRVTITPAWTEETVAVTIADDGPGFSADVMIRIGEPYVTSRAGMGSDDEPSGLGLGFFIAKTLLERSGAALSFENGKPPAHGAMVTVRWPRADFEQPRDAHSEVPSLK